MCSQTKLDRGIICNQLMQKKKSNKQNKLLTVCWWSILALRKMPLPLLKQTVHMQFTYFSIINIKIMHTISPFILLTYMYTNFQYVYSSLNLTLSIFMGLLVWSVVAGAGIVLSCLSLLSHQSFDLFFSCHPCYCTYLVRKIRG